MIERFDVLVAGAGPAGAATALALRRRGVERVVLVEASRFEGPRIGESVPPETRLRLAELGLWEAFAREGHEPCLGSCAAWGSDVLGYNDFLSSPYGHGWHLDRRRFDPWLARAAEAGGAELRIGARLDEVVPRAGGGFRARLGGDAGCSELTARFVVDATGRAARLARHLGASRLVNDRLTFLYGFFPAGALGDARLTILEAVPLGWWYAARLPGGRAVVALATDADAVQSGGLHHLATWRAHLDATRHLAKALTRGTAPDGPLLACEAPSSRLDRAADASGWLAVGDAASAFDPLSSQGLHKALEDGMAAAAAIVASGDGDAGPLAAYAKASARRFERYSRDRAYFYSLERRWPDAPFWARRRARAGSRAGDRPAEARPDRRDDTARIGGTAP